MWDPCIKHTIQCLLQFRRHNNLTLDCKLQLRMPPSFPPPFGWVSPSVLNNELDSFTRYVRSAFGCRPKISGESASGKLSMYFLKSLCSENEFAVY
ncbi:hypothetical protein ACHAXS_012881 [Conticribra weissflogii]